MNSEISVLLLKCINNESEGCWKRKGGLKVLTKAHSTLAVAKARAWKTSLSFWSMQAYSTARYIAERKWGWEEEESCLFRGRLLSCQAVRQRERGDSRMNTELLSKQPVTQALSINKRRLKGHALLAPNLPRPRDTHSRNWTSSSQRASKRNINSKL